jgi:type II secretory pathway component GspD/PulD (secretin)
MRTALLALALLFGTPVIAQPPPGVPRTIKIFHLKNADAEKLRPILLTIFERQGITVTVDGRTNSLVIAGDADTLKEVHKLVTKLDEPLKPKK